MSWSAVLPQPESMLMSVTPVATKHHTDSQDLGSHPVAFLVPESCAVAEPILT